VNSFYYLDPQTLPPIGPVYALSTEPHSFSRVFTGGFFEGLSEMLNLENSSSPTEGDLLNVSKDMAKLLVDAVKKAPIEVNYYSQVAACMIEADQNLFKGKYSEKLFDTFSGRGILTFEAKKMLIHLPVATNLSVTKTSRRRGIATSTKEAESVRATLPQIALDGTKYGLGTKPLLVHAPAESKRFQVTPAGIPSGSITPPTPVEAVRTFVEGLFRRGKVDVGTYEVSHAQTNRPFARKTHTLVEEPEGFRLVRLLFE
jgi:hypothetical protein